MAVKIHSGLLNKPVTFKRPVSSLNDEGGQVFSYSDDFTTMAFVTAFNERRVSEAHAVTLIGSSDFYIRYSVSREAITKDWLISYKGEDYTIHEIENIDKRFIRMTAKVSTDG